jgi:hypothetical protein
MLIICCTRRVGGMVDPMKLMRISSGSSAG